MAAVGRRPLPSPGYRHRAVSKDVHDAAERAVTSPATRSAEAVAPRGPGRPRDPRCHPAILEATLELRSAVGLGGRTMDAVAARAGASKARISRRWSSK